MFRRSFVGVMGAAAFAQTAPGSRTRFYLKETYYLQAGTQLSRLSAYLRQGMIAALGRVHSGPLVVLETVVAPRSPHIVVLTGYASLEQLWNVREKMGQDTEFASARETWQAGPEPPFQSHTSELLEAADYSPEVEPLDPAPATPRIFEMRVYHSASWRDQRGVHERFAGPETAIFKRLGIQPILYGYTVIGNHIPNLTWIIPFADLAEREKAWAVFGADPEWIKVRTESAQKYGDVVSLRDLAIYRAAAYSPVR